MSFAQKVIIILEVAAALAGIIYLIFKMIAHKSVSFDMTKGRLSYSGNDDKAQTMEGAISGVFILTLETVTMMTHIKTKLILHDQMSYLEERLIVVRDAILKSYRLCWKARTGESVSTKEYIFYQSLVNLMKENMKSNMRTFYLRNHFSAYSEQQLKDYINEKNELLMIGAYQYLRELYPEGKMTISFEDIVLGLDKIKPNLENCLSAAFKRAVNITKERNVQIAELESSLRGRIKTTYGVELNDSGVEAFIGAIKRGED